MKLQFTTLDVFTSTRYLGNPLAIVHLPAPSPTTTLTQAQKQAIAREFNFSETVFMHAAPAASTEVTIDIFMTHRELPFAGHPTVGSAFYLLSLQHQKHVTSLATKAGSAPVALDASGTVTVTVPHDVHLHGLTLNDPLDASAGSVRHPVFSVVNGMTFCFVLLPTLDALADATAGLCAPAEVPDFVQRLDEGWRSGLLGTMFYVRVPAEEGDGEGVQRYRTRMWGSNEDAASGSASSGLGAFLALQEKGRVDGREFMYKLTQGVEMGKESHIEVVVVREGDKVKSLRLGGTAVQVMEGTLEV